MCKPMAGLALIDLGYFENLCVLVLLSFAARYDMRFRQIPDDEHGQRLAIPKCLFRE
jgi:hypothetical protein